MYYYQHLTMILMYLYSFFHSVDLRRSSRRSKARFRPVPLGLQRRCGREALEPLEPEKIRAEVRWEVRFSQNSRVTWQDIRHDKAVQFDVLLMWIYIYIFLDLVKGGFCSIWNFSAMARSKLLRKPRLLSNRLRMALRFFSTVKWVTRWWEVHHSDMFFYTHKKSTLIGFSILDHPFWGVPPF